MEGLKVLGPIVDRSQGLMRNLSKSLKHKI